MKKSTGAMIQQITEEIGKTHGFNQKHNPLLPVQHWFQQTPEGLALFIVFYTQACRWSRCMGCNLPSKMNQNHIDFYSLMRQIDYLFEYILTTEKKHELKKIIISNNGSIFDHKTFSSTALFYFIAKMSCYNQETILFYKKICCCAYDLSCNTGLCYGLYLIS